MSPQKAGRENKRLRLCRAGATAEAGAGCRNKANWPAEGFGRSHKQSQSAVVRCSNKANWPAEGPGRLYKQTQFAPGGTGKSRWQKRLCPSPTSFAQAEPISGKGLQENALRTSASSVESRHYERGVGRAKQSQLAGLVRNRRTARPGSSGCHPNWRGLSLCRTMVATACGLWYDLGRLGL
jgi:hypothetical protein